MVAVRVAYQNEEVLKRGEFRDLDESVVSLGSPNFYSNILYLRGLNNKDDDYCDLVSRDKAIEIKEKVRRINEKYGIKKRWRAEIGEKYFCITKDEGEFMVAEWADWKNNTDNASYNLHNYFETKEQAERMLEKIKQVFKEEV